MSLEPLQELFALSIPYAHLARIAPRQDPRVRYPFLVHRLPALRLCVHAGGGIDDQSRAAVFDIGMSGIGLDAAGGVIIPYPDAG
jgi:hypothetical protein